jgi:ABC-type amino acid transport system permease subunit
MQESIQLVIDSLPYLLKGAVFTLQLSIGGMFFGLVLGFMLALMRMSPSCRCAGWRAFISPSFAARRLSPSSL